MNYCSTAFSSVLLSLLGALPCVQGQVSSGGLSERTITKPQIPDSLATIGSLPDDTIKVRRFLKVGNAAIHERPTDAEQYGTAALALARKLVWRRGEAEAQRLIGFSFWKRGEFQLALEHDLEALRLLEGTQDRMFLAGQLKRVGQDLLDGGRTRDAMDQLRKAEVIYKAAGELDRLAEMHVLYAYIHEIEGDPAASAMESQAALQIHESLGNKGGIAMTTGNIASAYAALGRDEEALKLYQRVVDMQDAEPVLDAVNFAETLSDFGQLYARMGRPDEAMAQFQRALETANSINDRTQVGHARSGMGGLQLRKGDHRAALQELLFAASEFEQAGFAKSDLARVYADIATCNVCLGNDPAAERYLGRVDSLAKEMNSRLLLTYYHRGMELMDSNRGDWANAYKHHKLYTAIRDSIANIESRERMVKAQMRHEFDKKEMAQRTEQEKRELRQRNIRNSISAGLAGALIFLVVVYRQRNKINKARKRSDELLLNILPEEVADELKAKGEAEAVQIDQVTVLFTDFKGFTAMSETMSPKELVRDLHECFSAFDNICEKHGLEKIKTIGDAYMAAGGLPTPNTTHATDVIQAALEMRDFIAEGKARKVAAGLPFFEVRVGIHTGPVVAGIVGVKKFQYDIWGDTVNTASRMESSGEPGQVNISEVTYALVKGENGLTFTPRGKVQAKGKGEMEMYFVTQT